MSGTPEASLEQLQNALAAGAIDRPTYELAAAAIAAQSGRGAVAAGSQAVAVGAGGVAIQGDNSGLVNLGVIIEQGRRPGASAEDLRRAYLARILVRANHVPLFASDTGSSQVRLSSVYTALLTQRSEVHDAIANATHAERRPGREERRLSAVDVLDRERALVLLGGPGSGKSTFVSIVALSMAGELLGDGRSNLQSLTAPLPSDEDDREKERPQHWSRPALIPVEIALRDLASQLPPPGMPVNADTVWSFIEGQLKQASLGDLAPALRGELLKRGGLVLLDGLDEVPDALDRRTQIKQAVQDFVATFSQCRFLVTSRTYAYQQQQWKLDGFAEAHLSRFTRGQMHRFIDAWYLHMVELLRLTEGAARERGDVLKRAVAGERLRELAERPLLLTLIAQLQTEAGGTLPEKREELYDKAVEMLLNKWESLKVRERPDGTKEVEPSLAEWLNAGRDDIRKQLNRLAFNAHREQPQLVGTADIRQAALVDALLKASANRADVKVKRLEEYLRDRAGILTAHGVGMYQFPHRSFQEYLAACHLTDDDFPDTLAELVKTDPNRWREVALLAGAKASRGSALSAWALAESLCVADAPDGVAAPEADHWGALVAGRVLVECADITQVAPRNTGKLARVRGWQRAIMRRKTLPAVERALAGRTLAAMGDMRPEVMTLDGMHFCFVPSGPFVMGDDDGAQEEKPEHTVQLAYPYFIARFPVTVAQWRQYLAMGVEASPDFRCLSGRDNDPVVYVSFQDSLKFCAALTDAWRQHLPAGFMVTLPSEAEWEKAARGGKSLPADVSWVGLSQLAETLEKPVPALTRNPFPRRGYAWGESFDADKANVESDIGESSAAGCYPTGDSPYGCEDMCGNVFEWTRSLWGRSYDPEFMYPYSGEDTARENIHADANVRRVVRGGSWDDHRDGARCAFRYWGRPEDRNGLLGFRVVLRSAPVQQL